MLVRRPDLLDMRVSLANTQTMSRPDARSVPPIIVGCPAGLIMLRNLSNGATTSGLLDAPAYSPMRPRVGPLTIPPSANGVAPIAATIVFAIVIKPVAIPNPAKGI